MTVRDSLIGEPRRRRYRFGAFVLDLDDGFLRRDGAEVPLRPKAFEVLKYLVLHHGRLVSKTELVEAIWPDAAVTDNSLSQCLFEIRRVLGDEAQSLIRTVARRGYVFDASVSIVMGDPHGEVLAIASTPPPVIVKEPPRPGTAEHTRLESPRALAAAQSPGHQDFGTMPTARTAHPALRLTAGLGLLLLLGLGIVLVLRGVRPSLSTVESPVQLTDFNDSAVFPSLSHDGRMLAFIRGGNFGTVGAPRGQVYVKLLPNGPTVQLTNHGGSKATPVFTPDDSRIVYTNLLSGLRWDSWHVPVFGGTPQPFLPNASGLVWLDDQRLVYSTIMSGAHMGIASSTESRSQYREIYFPARENGMAHRSAPSPDGKLLLVVEMTGNTWGPCRLLPLDGSSAGKLVSPPDSQCTSAAWSPDGRWMYFSSNAGGSHHIWRQRYPDGAPEQITFEPTEQEGTAITPDGKYLITAMGLQQASLWLHDVSGDRKLTDERYVTQPTMAPSGTRLFYVVRTQSSRGQTSGELWSVDLSSGVRQRVLPGLVIANYSLSHDATKIAFASSGNETGDGIWIADLERRDPPRRLIRGAELRAFFGAPGEIVYTGEDNRLYRMKEDGTGIEMISDDPVVYLSTVSPDGRWAVVIVPQAPNGVGTTSLAFMSLRDEQSFAVCNDDCSVGPRSFLLAPAFTWSLDGKWLFVNLVHFGMNTAKTVMLPYRSDASPDALWPKGLRLEKDIVANPGAVVINAAFTFPASGPDTYLSVRTSTQSNLYRVRLPQ